MDTNTNGAAAASNATNNDAPQNPGREKVLMELAGDVLKASGSTPETKVADPEAKLPAEGEKPKDDLSKIEGQNPPPTAEPEWSADQLAWFEKRAAAKTAEEITAVDAAAPEFSTDQVNWLKAQPDEAADPGDSTEDHLQDDADLKGRLDDATQEKINKRIGKEVAKTKEAKDKLDQALAENEDLKSKLKAAPVSPNVPTSGPLAEVMDEASLQRVASEAEQAMDQAESLMEQLETDPAAVEKLLRQAKVVLQGEDGTEDYSAASMSKFLKSARANADRTLRRELPKRVEFLRAADAFANEALALVPDIKDPKSDRRKTFDTVLQNAPWLKSQPHWPRTATIYALGVEQYMKLQGAKANAGKTTVKPKRPVPTVIPSPRGQAPAITKAKPGTVSDAVVDSALSGNRKDRLKFIQTLVPKQ